MASVKCIESLPYEMLLHILSYVTFEDLVHSVQHVCSRWKFAAQDDLLWRNRIYSPDQDTDDCKINLVLVQVPKLRTLILSQKVVKLTVLRAITRYCTHLKKIVFHKDQRLSVAFLRNLVISCPNLEHINIPKHLPCQSEITGIIAQFSKLKTLSLGGHRRNCFLELKPIADGCPALESIDLKEKKVRCSEFAYFLEKKKDKLHTLRVRWDTEDEKCTLPFIYQCSVLKTLDIDNVVPCDGISNEVVTKTLRSLKTVTSLTLSHLFLLDIDCVINVFEKQGMSQLVELEISSYHYYDDRLGEVIAKNCTRLKLLYLVRCYLSDQSLKSFCTLSELESVRLDCSDITDAGMVFLRKCTNLKYLSLVDCRKLTRGSMKLMIEFSNLQVLILDFCDIKGLPLRLISNHLELLSLLSINHCRNVDQAALTKLKAKMPNLVVYNRK